MALYLLACQMCGKYLFANLVTSLNLSKRLHQIFFSSFYGSMDHGTVKFTLQ